MIDPTTREPKPKRPGRLSDAALVLLSHAADRRDPMVLPPPESLGVKPGPFDKLLRSLLRQQLIEEVSVTESDQAWRTEAEGSIGLRITSAGLQAIGVPALEPGTEIPAPADSDNIAAAVTVKSQRKRRSGKAQDSEAPTGAPTPNCDSQGGPERDRQAVGAVASAIRPGTKLAQLVEALAEPEGRSIDQLAQRLGWQKHTVRAAITGLRKRGFAVTKATGEEGETRYRAAPPAPAATGSARGTV